MPDELTTPPLQSADAAGQAADTQVPPSEPVSTPQPEPVDETPVEPTPPPEESAPAPELTPEPPQSSPPSSVQDYGRAQQPQQSSPTSTAPALHGDIAKARAAMQDQKRKKLDKIMAKLAEKGPTTLKLRGVNKITNDEVEKLLHISDATATRYLQALEKENKIKQTGVTGKAVFYEKS